MSHSKRYRAAREKVEPGKQYELSEALALLKSLPATKFDATVEVHFRLGIDAGQSDQNVRGAVSLPKGTGKKVRVVAFTTGDNIAAAKAAGAIEAGADELVAKVEGGWFDFDVAVASPDMMGKVGKLGRVLGPKGLMPSPKAGSVTREVAKTVAEFVAGKVEYRSDSGGNLHVPVGKLSFPVEDLMANIQALMRHVEVGKPAGAKGVFIQKMVIASSMGPGIQLRVA